MKNSIVKTVICCTITTFILFTGKVSAQAMFSADSIKAQFIRDWQRAKIYTFSYLNTVPADKYSFKAMDSVRSFAQQMLHLSQGTFGLIGRATGQSSPVGGMINENRASAQTKDSVMYYVGASYDFALDALTKMDAGKLGERVSGGPFSETRFAWALKAFEHQTHHRGQTTIYIRLLGLRPPNEQLF